MKKNQKDFILEGFKRYPSKYLTYVELRKLCNEWEIGDEYKKRIRELRKDGFLLSQQREGTRFEEFRLNQNAMVEEFGQMSIF